MKRFLNIMMTAMAMLAVALVSAFLAMRLAIHGREVDVPNITGLTLQEATNTAGHLGLSLHLENKFYSADVPPGHILGQFPAAGASVRRDWSIRVTESLGPQQVSIPDVTGQSERPASLTLRRSSLELGTVASIVAPGDPGIVLAQTPPPNASGVDRPRVSLLISQTASASPQAMVMPQLTGLSTRAAVARASAAGLRIASAEEPASASGQTGAPRTTTSYHDSFYVGSSAGGGVPRGGPMDSYSRAQEAAGEAGSGVVIAQSPLSGHRVVRGESVRLTIAP